MFNELFIETEKELFHSRVDPTGGGTVDASCSFWNTYYCVGFGATQSAAIADMNYEIAESTASGELNGCTQFGEPEPVIFSGGGAWATSYCC